MLAKAVRARKRGRSPPAAGPRGAASVEGWQSQSPEPPSARASIVAHLKTVAAKPVDRVQLEAKALALAQAACPQVGVNAAATRHARRLFVGNLGAGITEAELTDLFNTALMAAGCSVALGPPVVSVSINSDKRFAFVELRCVAEASNTLALEGLACRGATLTLRRPNDYSFAEARKLGLTEPNGALNLRLVHLVLQLLNGAAAKVFVDNLPSSLTEADLKAAMSKTSQVTSVALVKPITDGASAPGFTEGGSGVLELASLAAVDATVSKLDGMMLDGKKLRARRAAAGPEAQEALQQLVEAHQQRLLHSGKAEDAHVVVRLKQALRREDLVDQAEHEALQHDIWCEGGKYGNLVAVTVPEVPAQAGLEAAWTGDVLLRYADAVGANRAAEALQDRRFGDAVLSTAVEAVQ